MRRLALTISVAALLGCSPPAQEEAPAPQTSPQVVACNGVTVAGAPQVRIEDETAVASAAADLRGGEIAPGVYDLQRAMRLGGATGWQGTRAVSLEVSEDASGVVNLNWAGAPPDGQVDRWTATLTETPQGARLTYTCGRIGDVEASFAVNGSALQLRLPDGANGSLRLDFARRT